MAKLFSKKRADLAHGGVPRYSEAAVFDEYGRTGHFETAANATNMLADMPDVIELGAVGGQADSTAGNATLTITVPTGKYWRLVGFGYSLTTDANVANRQVVVEPSDSTPTAFSTVTFPAQAASGTQNGLCMFESTYLDIVGDITGANAGTTVQGVGTYATSTITIGEPVTDGDTITVAGIKYTLLDTFVDAENNVDMGANEAGTKANLLAAITVVGGTPGTDYYTNQVANPYCTVPLAAWAGDVLTLQARYPGDWIHSPSVGATPYKNVEGFTHATNTCTDWASGVEAGFPIDGAYLGPGEKLVVTVTNGVAGDTLLSWLTYIQYDNDPRPA